MTPTPPVPQLHTADPSGACTAPDASPPGVPGATSPDATAPGVPDTAPDTASGRAAVHAAATSPYGAADPHRQDEAVDLRLAGPALAAWGAAALALGWSGGSVAAACAMAVALAAIGVAGAARRPERRVAGALVALAAVLLGAVA
ncbi:hypothetical protein [Streptomyces sp. CB02923]|uniref:hypothetical protein n=1 Tax=Streptomyces sp. CB02923 TaxID=1718985 RepID=UPI001F5B0441|nr:hypothetical protein [Streptomyces sp. CB02923]